MAQEVTIIPEQPEKEDITLPIETKESQLR